MVNLFDLRKDVPIKRKQEKTRRFPLIFTFPFYLVILAQK